MRFNDKIVLVTGGNRGIGGAASKLFAEEGAEVIINYRQDIDAAKNIKREIEDFGGKAHIFQADIGNAGDVKTLFDAIEKNHGRLDILVNNAGIVNPTPFLELTLEDWQKTYDTNITGVFLCCREAAKLMLRQEKGAIVNVSSIRGFSHFGRSPVIDYSSSKAAVINFSTTLAKELAPSIRVNSVAPGQTETDMVKRYTPQQLAAIIDNTIYLNRLIQPEEVAKAILFLASEDASAITGTVLTVDGGQNLS